MKTIAYWSPFLTNVATISAVINSAKSLKLYSKSYKPVIINACGEFSTYKDDLKKQGVELINLIPFNYHKFLFKEGFIKSRISYLIIFFLSFIPLIYFIIKNKPDYFICHLITSLPILISKIIPKKTKFILRISGLPKLNLFRKFYWSCFGNNMFLVTCPTIGTCNEIKNKNLFEQKKIILLRDPVIKINNICKQKNKKIDFKIEEKNFNIVCVGRLTKQKNFAFIINNFQNLIKLKPNSKLYILGDGEQKKYLNDLIINKKLINDIFLLGFQKNIFNYLSKANLFILTSLWEDPGWVLIEAAASNTLILSSNCKNGPEEFIENNKGGILYDVNADEDFIKKFQYILNLNDQEILNKKKFSKRKSKLFTGFNHYLSLKKILE